MDLWRWIPGFEGIYEISTKGMVYSHKTKRVRKVSMGPYKMCTLSKKGVNKIYTVHSLVAKAFIGNRPEGYQVNHKDGNKHNNNVDNLEYVTRSVNSLHSYHILGNKNTSKSNLGNFYGDSFRSRRIAQFNLDGNEVKTFDCIRRASHELSISETALSNCLNGRCNTSGGFLWKYV